MSKDHELCSSSLHGDVNKLATLNTANTKNGGLEGKARLSIMCVLSCAQFFTPQ